MPDSLLDVVQSMVLENEKPAKVVCEEVGKPYPTLLRELNPEDQHAKLGAQMLLPLMRACNSVAPLEHLAGRMGYRLTPLSQRQPTGDSMAHEICQIVPALAEFHRLALDPAATPDMLFPIMQRLIDEITDVHVRKTQEHKALKGHVYRAGEGWKNVAASAGVR